MDNYAPTARGERQLADWYYAQKNRIVLPQPEDAVIVTTLDPCCMCTGSILAGGFNAAISALDDTAGINFDGSNRFLPFDEPLETFFYPEVTDNSTVLRRGYSELPGIFTRKNLGNSIVEACSPGLTKLLSIEATTPHSKITGKVLLLAILCNLGFRINCVCFI